MRFIISVLVNAIGLWLLTSVFKLAGFTVVPSGSGLANQVMVFLLVALVLALVNAIVKPIVKVIAFPLYLLTLGLFGLVVNALMLMLTGWLTDNFTHTGLHIAGFATALWAALWLAVITVILNAIFGQKKR